MAASQKAGAALVDETASDFSDELDVERDDASKLSRQELLAINPFKVPNFSLQRLRYMAAFDVEKWVKDFEDLTFKTQSEPLTWDEGRAIMHACLEEVARRSNRITDDDKRVLEGLQKKLKVLLDNLKESASDAGFFVRLGTRSPKDAPMMACNWPCGVSKKRIEDALKVELETGGPGMDDAQDALRRFQSVCNSLLRVTSEQEALALLVNSSRVLQDIMHTQDCGEDAWDVSLVARLWDNEVRLEREFRTFVAGGRVTAISQYDDQLRYPFVCDHLDQIGEAIKACLERARPGLQRAGLETTAVVVDVLVVPPSEEGVAAVWGARIIELNPFGPMTGASLFNWTSDRRLLQGGLDVFGDLEECEQLHRPGSIALPAWVAEKCVAGGIPIRYCSSHPSTQTDRGWEYLEAVWEDYVNLAPAELLGRTGAERRRSRVGPKDTELHSIGPDTGSTDLHGAAPDASGQRCSVQ